MRVGQQYGADIHVKKVDVSVPKQVEQWIKDVVNKFGRLDGAANVAGVAGGDGSTVTETIVSRLSQQIGPSQNLVPKHFQTLIGGESARNNRIGIECWQSTLRA